MPTDEWPGPAALDSETIRRSCGELSDETVIAILDVGASRAEFEAALAWLQGRSEAMGEEPPPLEGAAARVYDLLIEEEPAEEG